MLFLQKALVRDKKRVCLLVYSVYPLVRLPGKKKKNMSCRRFQDIKNKKNPTFELSSGGRDYEKVKAVLDEAGL